MAFTLALHHSPHPFLPIQVWIGREEKLQFPICHFYIGLAQPAQTSNATVLDLILLELSTEKKQKSEKMVEISREGSQRKLMLHRHCQFQLSEEYRLQAETCSRRFAASSVFSEK